jgi:Fe2+ or Zn2+ uptake regulation protein
VPDSERYAEDLRRLGLRVTRLRLAIVNALHERGGVARAADLLEHLRRDHKLHKTTVHRNLTALEEAGLLRKVPSGGRSFLYELNCVHRPPVHPHFSCRRCQKVICLEPVDLTSVWQLLTHDRGLRPDRAEVTLVGLCESCAVQEPDTA